jgi:hypothetical protein
MLILEEGEKNLTDKDFLELTGKIGYTLPEALVSFYKTNNGGYPPDNNDEGNRFLLNGFHPIKHGHPTIEWLYEQMIEEYPETAGMLPFAYDDAGNDYLLSLRSGDYNRVYWREHEGGDLSSMDLSFQEFLEALAQAYGG